MVAPDSDTQLTLGGIMQNYDTPEDQTTDLDAIYWNMVSANVAQATNTVCNGWFRFQTSASTPTLLSWRSTTMVNTTTPPVIARTTTGIYTGTLPLTVLDELNGIQNTYAPNYNPVHNTNIVRAVGNSEGQYFAQVQCSFNLNVITIYVFNTGGTLTDAVNSGIGTSICIFLSIKVI